jgi:putative endonuclease
LAKNFYVYILASERNGTIYKGMTSDLVKRIGQHKFENGSAFTAKYEIKKLVWYKLCGTAEEAIKWEKRLRRYPRQWKVNLIEEMNPEWKDLFDDICK